MHCDLNGLALTTSSATPAASFNRLMASFLASRADTPRHLAAALADDPEFGLAHCVRGYLAAMSFDQGKRPIALAAAREARRHTRGASARERAHVDALDAWAAGDLGRAASVWDQILAEHPRDVLAFRLAHFLHFWLGRPDRMVASVEAVAPHWDAALPSWGTFLACRCFALEECGRYPEAEAAGRAAIAHDPSDLWAAHGLTHVLEMQGRREEGIAWIERLSVHWGEANNLRHHLFWHAALFHLENGDTGRVLALYDTAIRDLASPLTQAAPDLYIDVQNAASLLFRLGRLGVDVGGRWGELADKAESRIGDCLSAFTLPHWMMALCAEERFAAAERMLEAIRLQAGGPGEGAAVLRRHALPVCAAVLAHARGAYAQAVAWMRPALDGMGRLGGSHAQRDVLDQLYLDAAERAGLDQDARLLLERVAGRWPVPPARRVSYAATARRLGLA
ncbi:MAG TPA: tetratricopeptide repeat protein [Acetobacteraceae bacterium]|nr:tetratricopeptide repeat protein [Acetobacteraceae bacterium]